MTDRRPLLGVSACLFRGSAVLLVERLRPPYSGMLSLPGGKVEFGESLVAAVRREIREETGLGLGGLAFHRLHEAIDVAGGIHAVIAVFRAEVEAGRLPLAADDAAAVRFVRVEELGGLESAGRLTPGLAEIVREASFRHSPDAK